MANKINGLQAWRRIALVVHMGKWEQGEDVQFAVPPSYYDDGVARSFCVPTDKVMVRDERAGLVFRTAVYADYDYCQQHCIPGIKNPPIERRQHRGH